MIKLSVIGHLGQKAKINEINGKKVINFSIAHSDNYTDKETGEIIDKTTWVNCSLWSEKIDVAKYMHKGRLIAVEGKPKPRFFQNENGQTIATIDLHVRELELLGKNVENKPENTEENKGEENGANSK